VQSLNSLANCNMATPCLGMSSETSRSDVIEPGMLMWLFTLYLLKII